MSNMWRKKNKGGPDVGAKRGSTNSESFRKVPFVTVCQKPEEFSCQSLVREECLDSPTFL